MRTIKFRGKCCHSDAWAYGNLVDYGEDEYPEIQGFDIFREGRDVWQGTEVEWDTIGQFTGLLDKNGKEIYEGDIVKTAFRAEAFGAVVWHENGYFFIDEHFGLYKSDCDYSSLGHMLKVQINGKPTDIEVIGNIHDNPELLEGGEE